MMLRLQGRHLRFPATRLAPIGDSRVRSREISERTLWSRRFSHALEPTRLAGVQWHPRNSAARYKKSLSFMMSLFGSPTPRIANCTALQFSTGSTTCWRCFWPRSAARWEPPVLPPLSSIGICRQRGCPAWAIADRAAPSRMFLSFRLPRCERRVRVGACSAVTSLQADAAVTPQCRLALETPRRVDVRVERHRPNPGQSRQISKPAHRLFLPGLVDELLSQRSSPARASTDRLRAHAADSHATQDSAGNRSRRTHHSSSFIRSAALTNTPCRRHSPTN